MIDFDLKKIFKTLAYGVDKIDIERFKDRVIERSRGNGNYLSIEHESALIELAMSKAEGYELTKTHAR